MLKLRKTAIWILILGLSAAFSGCNSDPEPVKTTGGTTIDSLSGVFWLLNEGLFNQNNSTLSRVDLGSGSVRTCIFTSTNNRRLGDTGNDIAQYGKQVWIVVNVSSTVEVVRAGTAASLRQIPLRLNNRPMQPRSIAFWEGRAYITCYSGHVAVVDTETFTVEANIPVGRYPEGIKVVGNEAFVANSGGVDFPNYDSTVSVIDLLNQTELRKINVGANPGELFAFGNKVWVVVRGNVANNVKPKIKEIDASTKTVTTIDAGTYPNAVLAVYKGRLIRYVKENRGFTIRDVLTDAVVHTNNVVDVTTPYGLWTDDSQNLFMVGDAIDYTSQGRLVFMKQGSSKSSWVRVGVNPGHLIKP